MLPFVGPSYVLPDPQASAARTVNMRLMVLETPSKAQYMLRAMPGLRALAALPAPIRGGKSAKGRAFFVGGDRLIEVAANGSTIERGTLLTSSGQVGMAWGTEQLVIVDGANGYTFDLAGNVFSRITDPDFPGSAMVEHLNGRFILQNPQTQQFYTTALNDAGDVDALDYASAEAMPDNIVGHTVSNQEAVFLGAESTEIWYPDASQDFPLSRRLVLDVGCIARWSICRGDRSVFFVGRDENGGGMVYRLSGYQVARISTLAVEKALAGSSDIAAASGYTYQANGQTFYCLQAPGVASTLVYEVGTNSWVDLCDLDSRGEFVAHRGTHHVYAYGMHLIGAGDGRVYEMRDDVHTYGDDPRVCERTSPHDAMPAREKMRFNEFWLDCTTGDAPLPEAPSVELSWANDGGQEFGDPVLRASGALGDRSARLVWRRLGMARDRVWRVRFSAAAPFSIIAAGAK